MLNFNYAIKLGSVNTVIVKAGEGVQLIEPSLLAVTNDKKPIIRAVGNSAKKIIGKTDNNISIIEPIKDGVIVNKYWATAMLKKFLEMINCKNTFKKNNVLLLTPSSITNEEKNEYINIAYSVGFSYAQILPSTIPAMVALEVEEYDTRSHLLCHLSGGVCDLSVINTGTIINGCTIDLGGKVLDTAIKHYVADNYNVDIRENVAEDVKKELATLLPNDVIDFTVAGINTETTLHNQITLTSQEIRPLFMDYFVRVANVIEALLNSCSPEVVADINKRGIYMFGGLAQVTGADRFLKNRLNIPVYVDVDPENTIINGTTALLNNPQLLHKLVARLK